MTKTLDIVLEVLHHLRILTSHSQTWVMKSGPAANRTMQCDTPGIGQTHVYFPIQYTATSIGSVLASSTIGMII